MHTFAGNVRYGKARGQAPEGEDYENYEIGAEVEASGSHGSF